MIISPMENHLTTACDGKPVANPPNINVPSVFLFMREVQSGGGYLIPSNFSLASFSQPAKIKQMLLDCRNPAHSHQFSIFSGSRSAAMALDSSPAPDSDTIQ